MIEQQKLERTQVRRNRFFLISIAIILIATMTPGTKKIEVYNLDKVVHFSIFLFLSINICFKYQNYKRLLEVMIWAIFFGLMTEIIQQFIPGRDMDIYDGVTDVFGIISGYYIYRNFQQKLDKILKKIGA